MRSTVRRGPGVYPRVYGGTSLLPGCHDYKKGLSPRVRGNQRLAERHAMYRRSIPACTGEPSRENFQVIVQKVYPRVYGGTGDGLAELWLPIGLSPRVRGNLRESAPRLIQVRSIPACTGEPLWPEDGAKVPLWSIPACTGEPGLDRPTAFVTEVYPRVYGGTRGEGKQGGGGCGLSPRVRGNPQTMRLSGWENGLSPRVRGNPQARPDGTSMGLSPRVRGNHANTCHGSIPACTGEPSRLCKNHRAPRVYPRVYGGTKRTRRIGDNPMGLSPRVRGNLFEIALSVGLRGSIPACTGEPRS